MKSNGKIITVGAAPAVTFTAGTTGPPGPPGPKGPEVGTPVVAVAFDEPWPPLDPVPGTVYLRLAE